MPFLKIENCNLLFILQYSIREALVGLLILLLLFMPMAIALKIDRSFSICKSCQLVLLIGGRYDGDTQLCIPTNGCIILN